MFIYIYMYITIIIKRNMNMAGNRACMYGLGGRRGQEETL